MELFSTMILAQGNGGGGGGGIGGLLGGLLCLILAVVVLAGGWKMFTKAGKPGWAYIIPFYNLYVLCEIAGRPLWWFLVTLLVPCVGQILAIILCFDIAKSYGKGAGFGVGLVLLPVIFIPMLGFGDAKYVGPAAAAGAGGAAE